MTDSTQSTHPDPFDLHDAENRAAQEAFGHFLENIPGGIFRYSADEPGRIDYVSRDLILLMGCADKAAFDQLTGGCFSGIVHPDDRQRVLESIEQQIAVGDTDEVVYRLNRADGEEVWVDDRGRLITDSAGRRWFYVLVVDVTSKIISERELKRAHERMNILTALSNDVVFDIECGTGYAQVFGDFKDRFAREPRQEDFVVQRRCHKECHLDIHTTDLSELMEAITPDSLVDFETSTEGPDGEPVWYRYQSVVLYDEDNNAVRHVGRLLDTHEMALRESQFRRRAEKDGLTGLYNRSAALNRIEPALRNEEAPFTFFLIDIDDFKGVNDTYGHPEGDRVLIELADFLTNVMRHEDVVARLGGDEFAIFAKGLKDGAPLKRIIEHLTRGPFATQRHTDDGKPEGPLPSISIGAVHGKGGPLTFEEVYAQADAALYEAKQRGKAQACVKPLAR